MKIETRTKEIQVNVYIARDGKEYSREEECLAHEKILDGYVLSELAEKANLGIPNYDDYSGVRAYISAGSYDMWLVKVTEELAPLIKNATTVTPRIGDVIFIDGDGGEWWYDGSIDTVIANMERDLAELKRIREENMEC